MVVSILKKAFGKAETPREYYSWKKSDIMMPKDSGFYEVTNGERVVTAFYNEWSKRFLLQEPLDYARMWREIKKN
ncbi:MAG: hypothetical protein V2I33_09050 [Kangiellaceae bacterium]|jgi:hypothetical protein|nr:hypothetical protein [Kangiellaceae bacterium]